MNLIKEIMIYANFEKNMILNYCKKLNNIPKINISLIVILIIILIIKFIIWLKI